MRSGVESVCQAGGSGRCVVTEATLVGPLCGGAGGNPLLDEGLRLLVAGHGPHLELHAVVEHQHHVAPEAEAPGHGAHLADLAVDHLGAVAAEPAAAHLHAPAGDPESQP